MAKAPTRIERAERFAVGDCPLVRQNRQDHGYGHAVIPAQGRPLGPDPLPVGGHVQPLPAHVLAALRQLGADHVQVTLENHRGRILIARTCRLPDHQIVMLVLPEWKAQLPGEARAEIADLLRIAAAVGHSAQLFKIREYLPWFQLG